MHVLSQDGCSLWVKEEINKKIKKKGVEGRKVDRSRGGIIKKITRCMVLIKGISAIGAAGFCWGAKVVVERSKSDYLQAAVLLHPSLVTVDDIKELKVPIAILGAEIDKISPPELLKQFEEGLSSKREINGYVKIFPGVAHGWTVRYKVDDEKAEIKGKLYGSN
ncbi:carboxymethylenebutenolidase homolog [Camellia sinensis]|uniref:carboxymethylenebutenolidase homolog n=1 Tax=Camellia sinensis TaxID=4442 RepID=UPI001035E7F0|nr:carboxymethylenebutenolidase homolog [Camellia sinensis]